MKARQRNKQPFYHRIEVTFTTTHGTCDGIEKAIRDSLLEERALADSIVFEVNYADAGDPADLL